MNHRKMLKNCSKVNHIIGEIGPSLGEGTACIYGVMQQPWNYLMAVTDGLDLSWMENLPPCIQVVVPKVDRIVQVIFCFYKIVLLVSINLIICFSAHFWTTVEAVAYPWSYGPFFNITRESDCAMKAFHVFLLSETGITHHAFRWRCLLPCSNELHMFDAVSNCIFSQMPSTSKHF